MFECKLVAFVTTVAIVLVWTTWRWMTFLTAIETFFVLPVNFVIKVLVWVIFWLFAISTPTTLLSE